MTERPNDIFPAKDLDDFAKLTAQESHSIEGQITKMHMIWEMVDERYKDKIRTVTDELTAAGYSGPDLADELGKRVQKLHVHKKDIGDGRFNLIFEKGEGDDDDLTTPVYRVMIPAHIDTVVSDAQTELDLDIQNPDRLKGLGVYDMGAGVLNNISLAVDSVVPKGVKVYFVFTVDEEERSLGSRNLTEQWEVFPLIDAVVSSEIGPVPPKPDGDPTMFLIAARSGREKFHANITLDPGIDGHGADERLPNASEAMHEAISRIKSRFYDGFEGEPPLQESHPLLGKEFFEHGEMHAVRTKRTGYRNPDSASFDFSVRLAPVDRSEKVRALLGTDKIPPDLLGQMEAAFRKTMFGIAKRREWKKYGIGYSLQRKPDHMAASYAPYDMPLDHPLIRIASETMMRVSGVAPEIVGAPSVSDECDYSEEMLKHNNTAVYAQGLQPRALSFRDTNRGVISLPPNGDHAHSREEWVSQRSIMQTRQVIKSLIEDPTGFSSLNLAFNANP